MVILQWTNDEFISYKETKSESNYSDSLSKPTERTKFNEHCDIFMGRRRPAYTALNTKQPHDDALSSTDTIIHYISCSALRNQKHLYNNPMYSLLNEQQFH